MSEENKRRTQEEILADQQAAYDRWIEGYPLPPLPVTEGRWTKEWELLAKKFLSIANQRHKDCYRVTVTDEQYYQTEVSLTLITHAMQSKDVELLSLYHRFLFATAKPKHILYASKAFRSANGDAVLEQQHIDAFSAISKVFHEEQKLVLRDSLELPDVVAISEIAACCFEGFSPSRLETVLTLLDRGVKRPAEIRAAMDSFDGVELALLDGAL